MTLDQQEHPVKKCFAYNRDSLRCMQTAGHTGNHAHAIEWGDDECFDPTSILYASALPTTMFDADADAIHEQVSRAEEQWANRATAVDTEALAQLDFGYPATEPVVQDGGKCVACDHRHTGGKCRCGCETAIPRLG